MGNIDKKGHEPFKRLREFYNCLFSCLKKGARAALQFYPETAGQVEMITSAALRCGFGGGLVVDFPHSAKGFPLLDCPSSCLQAFRMRWTNICTWQIATERIKERRKSKISIIRIVSWTRSSIKERKVWRCEGTRSTLLVQEDRKTFETVS